ncbi:MAG: hypothetical protein J5927_04955 [Oscillospiraceae bacterium]|nr:hypothetical protein [Oscillospiraceae bacterium]
MRIEIREQAGSSPVFFLVAFVLALFVGLTLTVLGQQGMARVMFVLAVISALAAVAFFRSPTRRYGRTVLRADARGIRIDPPKGTGLLFPWATIDSLRLEQRAPKCYTLVLTRLDQSEYRLDLFRLSRQNGKAALPIAEYRFSNVEGDTPVPFRAMVNCWEHAEDSLLIQSLWACRPQEEASP